MEKKDCPPFTRINVSACVCVEWGRGGGAEGVGDCGIGHVCIAFLFPDGNSIVLLAGMICAVKLSHISHMLLQTRGEDSYLKKSITIDKG